MYQVVLRTVLRDNVVLRPHLKYVATLLCNLLLMTCFADINVLQGNVATYARCSGIFIIHLTANLPGNLLVKIFFKNSVRLDRSMVMSLWPYFVYAL